VKRLFFGLANGSRGIFTSATSIGKTANLLASLLKINCRYAEPDAERFVQPRL
jgi:hypothetical protein